MYRYIAQTACIMDGHILLTKIVQNIHKFAQIVQGQTDKSYIQIVSEYTIICSNCSWTDKSYLQKNCSEYTIGSNCPRTDKSYFQRFVKIYNNFNVQWMAISNNPEVILLEITPHLCSIQYRVSQSKSLLIPFCVLCTLHSK